MSWPYVAWLAAFVVVPMLLIFLYAFTEQGNDVLTFTFTLDNFKRFFSDTIFPTVLWRSVKIAFITTVICIAIGYPAAYMIAKMPEKTQSMMILLITLPMWINVLIRTYAWKGLLSDLDWSSDVKVMIGMVYNFLPYMIIQIYTSLNKIDRSLITAANDLGADNVQTFLRVTLPLSMPGVVSGITLVFLPAVSCFFIPKLLGGGEYVLIGNLIENYFISIGNWNYGSAISLILVVVIMISMYISKKLDRIVGNEE